MRLWARLEARHWKLAPDELLNYSDPAGHYPLRESVAAYLQTSRGVVCTPEQVIITTGSQQGLDLAARLLLDPGEAVWVEDPGYLGARGAFLAAGARVVAVGVDREGLDVAAGRRLEPRARLAYVTPSHQYPLGVTLSLRRRLELLEWASEHSAWIVEDDYDSEYRYRGRPLAALQGLDRQGRVIYVGTFSKVMMPGLRLGYLVVPPDLVEAFVAGRALMDRHPPGPVQAVLAEFIREGHFVRHIKRTRLLYAERQEALIQALRRHFGGWLEVEGAEAGLHLAAWLPPGIDDQEASRLAAEQGIEALPLSAYSLCRLPRGGLMLGYAAFTPAELAEGVAALREALAPLMREL
jgi:GntR family transcriptional regulator/MocR family aminotransferase